MQITAHPHLIQQAARKRIPMAVVQEVLRHPGLVYKAFVKKDGKRVPRLCQHHGVQQQTWTGEHNGVKIALAVYTCCQKAITVWQDQVETEVRPDQKKNGVTGYYGRDGKWRAA